MGLSTRQLTVTVKRGSYTSYLMFPTLLKQPVTAGIHQGVVELDICGYVTYYVTECTCIPF